MPWVKGSGIAAAAVRVSAGAWVQALAQELPYALDETIKKIYIYYVYIPSVVSDFCMLVKIKTLFDNSGV